MDEIRYDCRLYRGSKPCRSNKERDAECSSCPEIRPYDEKVLIIKLDAIGDVLRTACVLPKPKEHNPANYIVWITKAESCDLLASNPYIDEVWAYEDPATLVRLQYQEWDRAYNFDNAHASCALASLVRAQKKTGFLLSRDGHIVPTNMAAARWLHMASFDRLKQENTRSYQEILHDICDLDEPFCRPELAIPAALTERARQLMGTWFPLRKPGSALIGINTGSGARWPLKMLNEARIAELTELLLRQNDDWHALLLGGPNEAKKNSAIMARIPSTRVADAGCAHTLLEFAALIKECDTLVCGDTLALHMATALGVPATACFGPTSAVEIHDYNGLIAKITPRGLSCLCCYNGSCRNAVTCMDIISLADIRMRVYDQLTRDKGAAEIGAGDR